MGQDVVGQYPWSRTSLSHWDKIDGAERSGAGGQWGRRSVGQEVTGAISLGQKVSGAGGSGAGSRESS